MRLICGVFQLDGSDASEQQLRALVAQLRVPRLSPAIALWREGPVGLAVLDFAHRGTTAPSLPEQNGSIIAADARLDKPAGTGTDDAQLLATFTDKGPDGLKDVLGDFAFACWNRNQQRLTCGRDVFGIRPFAYTHQPGKLFAFASFENALQGSGIVPKTIDEDVVARRFVMAFRADDSLIAGIKRLPASHYLEVSRAGVSLKRYWQLDRAAIGTYNCSPEEAARELRSLIDEAVRCRIPANGEIGAHLSGGLDSSALSVLAARQLRNEGRKLHAYSFLDRQRNDIQLEDETAFVNAVLAQETDIDWAPIRPPAALPEAGLPMDVSRMTPLDPEGPEETVCALAEGQKVGVILSGWGGDEAATFNGRGVSAELLLRGRWRILGQRIQALRRERGHALHRTLWAEIGHYLVPEPLLDLAKTVLRRRSKNLRTQFGQSLTPAVRKAAVKAITLSITSDARENRWRLTTSPHIAERAEVWAQTGARHGLAFVFPLLDRRVVEFALSLPSELFQRGGFRRRPFRDAMVGVLPDKVRLRHAKYQPFPGRMIDISESKDALLKRLERYENNETVRRVIDLGHVRAQLESLPSADRVRWEMRDGDNPEAAATMITVMQSLSVAEYLVQHGAASDFTPK